MIDGLILKYKQVIHYAIVGITTNIMGYCIYLLITSFGANPKLAMTILYLSAASLGYFANRRVTFNDDGAVFNSSMRYVLMHIIAYLLNLSILIVFVDILLYPHYIVQMVAIFIVALFIFITSKFFVFQNQLKSNQ
jgi:putative flippase GtrA